MNWKFRCKNFVKIFFLYTLTVFPTNQETSEILKVATSCKSVRCNKGYYCMVKVYNCSWGENCTQKIAKCVIEKEYYEATASCADFQCPDGHKCILRESLCTRQPCKVLKSCARNSAADNWFRKCKQLGCTSEYECFIRRPTDKCDNKICKHIPDCMLPPENELNKHCRGWICPLKMECLAHMMGPCQSNDCQIFRTCRSTVSSKSRFKTLPDIEREWFYQEEEKWKKQSILTTPMSIIDKVPGYDRKKQLFFKPINTISSIQDDNLEILNRARVMPNSQSGTYKNSPSTSVWLKSLKSKSGMDVVNFWLKEAEKNQHNLEFHEWLESIRETLGPEKYRIWLENVRSQTSHSKKFQDWLPIPLPIENNYNQNLNQYNDFESKINDMEGEILSVFPKTRLDDTFEILENGDILTTMKPVEKFSNFNNSINTSEMGNNSIIPTFIIIQTLPNELTPSISNPQMFNHQILDPTNNKKFQPKFRNFRTPFPTYQYLPKNDYHQQIKSSSQFLPWFNLLNYSPNDQSTTTQLNQNLIPENYLQNFLLPLQDQKSIIYWYHPAFGYINLHPQYDINNNYDDESIDDKNNYFQRKDKFHSRRRINWGEFFKNRNKNNFPKNSRRKELLDKQNFEIDNDNKNEEEEIQFLKKILQEILDYNFEEKILDENENKNSRDSEKIMRNEKHEKKKKIHKNERKKEIESENKKENEQENENENAKDNEKEKTKKQERKKQNKKSKKKENEKNEKEIENNSDDVLMETLFNMIKEQLSNNQDNVTNLQLEMLLDEVGKNENDTQLLTDEFEKFLENFENPEEETDDDT